MLRTFMVTAAVTASVCAAAPVAQADDITIGSYTVTVPVDPSANPDSYGKGSEEDSYGKGSVDDSYGKGTIDTGAIGGDSYGKG